MILINYYNFSLFVLFFLFGFFICIGKLHWNLGPLFIYRLMVTPSWILNLILLVFFYCIFYLLGDFLNYNDLISYMVDKDTTNINIGENATVNVNDGKVSLQINHMNRVAAAISATGGVTAGIQVAKYVAGPPAIKVVAGVATGAAVQLTTTFMSKILDTNNNTSKLVANLIQSSNENNVLNDYPLNLLFEINGFLICALIFLYIILNIYITKYIISAKADLVKYIPTSIQNHKIGVYLNLWLNKYLNLWSKSSNYFLAFCYFMLLFCVLMCKLGLYLILSA